MWNKREIEGLAYNLQQQAAQIFDLKERIRELENKIDITYSYKEERLISGFWFDKKVNINDVVLSIVNFLGVKYVPDHKVDPKLVKKDDTVE